VLVVTWSVPGTCLAKVHGAPGWWRRRFRRGRAKASDGGVIARRQSHGLWSSE